MISFRTQLAKIGYSPSEAVSYRDFFLAPDSLRETMRSMDFPGSFWEAIPGKELNLDWTEEIQGCAFAYDRWFLVSNAEGNPRLLWRDVGATNWTMMHSISLLGFPPPDPTLPGFSSYHFGALVIHDEEIFIDHWCTGPGGQILVLQWDGAAAKFSRWIALENVNNDRVMMIGINFAKRRIITSGGKKDIDRIHLHYLDGENAGKYANRTRMLNPRIQDGCYAQGGFWSPNNHLYISSGQGDLMTAAKDHQFIYCYSPLNGRLIHKIPVRSAEGRQELEGCCYAPIVRQGQFVQFHAVLLENEYLGAKDDIYLKSFSADHPELL